MIILFFDMSVDMYGDFVLVKKLEERFLKAQLVIKLKRKAFWRAISLIGSIAWLERFLDNFGGTKVTSATGTLCSTLCLKSRNHVVGPVKDKFPSNNFLPLAYFLHHNGYNITPTLPVMLRHLHLTEFAFEREMTAI